jgi:hypothetical protein
VEIPFLCVSSIRDFDDHISVIDQVKVSTTWQFRDNVEVSFNIETESLVELTFLWFSLPLINVHDIPLLIDFAVSSEDLDVLVLTINSSLHIQYLFVFDVSNESSINSPKLPPS